MRARERRRRGEGTGGCEGAETDDDATFARLVLAIHRPEPHIMLFKRKKSEE